MHESTEYHNNFSRAFPEATPHSTSFELRQSDPPPPELEVILVTGNTNSTTQSICARFAKDFGFYHIDVPRRLRDLAEDDAFNEPVIGSLHPLGLRHYIATGKNVPAFFVLQFLHYGVDDGVKRGRTKFMYSGLDEDAETAMGFSKKIAKPASLFSFVHPETEGSGEAPARAQISDVRAAIEKHYADVSLTVEVAEDEAVAVGYGKLIAEVSRRAFSVPEVAMDDENMGDRARADSIVSL